MEHIERHDWRISRRTDDGLAAELHMVQIEYWIETDAERQERKLAEWQGLACPVKERDGHYWPVAR